MPFLIHVSCFAFIPLCCSAFTMDCSQLHSHLLWLEKKIQRKFFLSVALLPKVNVNVGFVYWRPRTLLVLEVVLVHRAAWTGSSVLSSLHVCIINCLRYQPQLFRPCRHLALIPKIKSSDCIPLKQIITLLKVNSGSQKDHVGFG